jgi:hypothetical protein
MTNGWVLGPNSELLFWVPPEWRDRLWRPNNVAIISSSITTKLDLNDFVHGAAWTLCKEQLYSQSIQLSPPVDIA